MQFHHHGYVSKDPKVLPAHPAGLERPTELPDTMDVLIVGGGPAGHIAAAQLAAFPTVHTRLIEQRDDRLPVGNADGIQARSVETFQAFGFGEEIMKEAYHITEMAFWRSSEEDPSKIVRASVPVDDPTNISEFPHLIVNQARVQDHFLEVMEKSPSRMRPDYGWEFLDLTVHETGDHPVEVHLRRSAGPEAGTTRTVRAKFVLGADGARSRVRSSIGRKLAGDQAFHAWGVVDALANTDFPDIRTKCSIQSEHGNILHIPREGGYLFRMYVDLGEVAEDDHGRVRETTLEDTIAQANRILNPYTIDVRHVARYTVYEVGHRVTDKFDDVPAEHTDARCPRVFIAGDACHTHSAKAGQGMNVSLQDGFNIAWKLGHVLSGRSPESLLSTYSAERQVIAQNLIDFDKEWSTLMATKPEDLPDATYLEDFYVKTAEFPAGFMTEYSESMITAGRGFQAAAAGYPIGKRFKSEPTIRVADAVPVHLGHHAQADGRWRIYCFADAPNVRETSALREAADWLAHDPASPVQRFTPAGSDPDALFDVKAVYQQSHAEFDTIEAPEIFRPLVGPFEVTDYEKVYAVDPEHDVFDLRGIDRSSGAIVVVRPDQYVAHVLPLAEHARLADFFAPILLPAEKPAEV